jgi:hypothetical protein
MDPWITTTSCPFLTKFTSIHHVERENALIEEKEREREREGIRERERENNRRNKREL